MKIAFICDMHLPESKKSPQYAFFKCAVEQMKSDGIEIVADLGDITAYGELLAFEACIDGLDEFEHYYVLGNSDVRDNNTLDAILARKMNPCFKVGTRTVIGINTPYGDIDEYDRARLEKLSDNDVVFLHHYVNSLHKDSRDFIEALAKSKKLTVVHGHAHSRSDYMIGETRVIGLRALDPDKSIGDFPCVTYLDISEEGIAVEEKLIGLPFDAMLDAREHFGISCVDNLRDLSYSIEDNVKNIEIRCRKDSEIDYEAIPLVNEWREKTDGYLSLHMPDLKLKDGVICGIELWKKALEYAKALRVNGLTIHPPRAKLSEMERDDVWNGFLSYYADAVRYMGDKVSVGIENLHMSKGERDDEQRGFGYTPKEVSSWIDAINSELGERRVGHVLDVGHARNNGNIASTHPISRWYELMGNRTVAYHIHQDIKEGNGLKNHCPITDWFGPMISYASFFYAWKVGMINKVPVFLEVKGAENYEISIKAFEKAFI